jgi:hypothetical protein
MSNGYPKKFLQQVEKKRVMFENRTPPPEELVLSGTEDQSQLRRPTVHQRTNRTTETHSKTSRHPSNYETSPHMHYRTNVSLDKRPTTT